MAPPWLRKLRRRVLVAIRKPFRIDEDDIRDHVLGRLLEDNQAITQRLADAVVGLSFVHARLKFYEEHIPRMRELRHQFDLEQKQKHEARASADGLTEAERLDLANGILPLRRAAANGAAH